jgi:hypothetical protein
MYTRILYSTRKFTLFIRFEDYLISETGDVGFKKLGTNTIIIYYGDSCQLEGLKMLAIDPHSK